MEEKKKKKKNVISIRVNEETKRAFEKFCEENDVSLSQLGRIAIKEYIERH